MKGILKGRGKGVVIPERTVPRSAVGGQLHGHAGFPEATDSLAYDAVQRLIAVGTSDGRIKLIGRPGVEALLLGTDASSTKQLLFLNSKGGLVRITEEGDLQLWSVADLKLVDSLPCADPALVVTQISDSPYLCIGCESGAIQFVQLTTRNSAPAAGVCEARALELLPHELPCEELGGKGQLIHLAALEYGNSQRLLALHSESGVVIWDVRRERAVVRMSMATSSDGTFGLEEKAEAALAAAGPARSACWVGSQGLSFATGHEMGSALVWVVPSEASGELLTEPLGPELIMRVPISDGELAMPVQRLIYMEGDCLGGSTSLLVFGGQVLDQPDSLSIVSLDALPNGRQPHTHPLPWYGNICGFAVVPQKGAFAHEAAPAAILVLMEGGQLVLFDLPDLQPTPLSLPLQELPDVTVSLLACSAEGARDALGPHAVTLERLQVVQKLESIPDAVGSRTSDRWRWVFDGGKPAEPTMPPRGVSDLLFTGHKDGRVRVWDTTFAVPALVATVPFDSGGAGAKLRSVAALEVDTASGLLVVSHEKGEVRVYQFAQIACRATSLEIQSSSRHPAQEEESGRRQPPGFQRILRLSFHTSTVKSLSIRASEGLLASGDEAGKVSVVSLSEPSLLWHHRVADQAVPRLHFIATPIPALRTSAERLSGNGEATDSCTGSGLLVLLADGSFTGVDPLSGKSLGTRTIPRTADVALSITPLAASGLILPAESGPLDLLWASNGQASSISAAVDSTDEIERPGAILARRGGSQRSILSSPNSHDATSPSYASTADAQPGGVSEVGEQLSELSTRGSLDEDTFLAAAAKEAEASREVAGRKHRLRTFFKGEGAPSKRHGDQARDNVRDREGSTAAALWKRGQKQGEESSSSNLFATQELPFKVRLERAASTSRSQAQQSSAQNARDEGPAFLLVATSSFLRVYPADAVQSGDRTTLRKVTLDEPISLAAPFTVKEGTCLACLTATGNLQIFSLPGLELLSQQPLSEVLGFQWKWAAEAAVMPDLSRSCSIGEDGSVFLTGIGWEAARLTVAKIPGWQPSECTALYDWDLAEAAVAAATVALPRRRSQPIDDSDYEILPSTSKETLSPGIQESKRGLGGFLNHVKEGVVNVGSIVDITGREIGKNIGHLGHAIAGHKDEDVPSLERVLSSSHQGRASARSRQPTDWKSERGDIHDRERTELLGNRRRNGRPEPRTADEIKAAYGRTVSKKASSVGALAEETRARLAERGERLQSLNDKAGTMANDAQDFATMARQIRDREANRKWWQL